MNYLTVILKGLNKKEKIKELKDIVDYLENSSHDNPDVSWSTDDDLYSAHAFTFDAPDCNCFDLEHVIMTFTGEPFHINEGHSVVYNYPN
jgi:hypothetical protein